MLEKLVEDLIIDPSILGIVTDYLEDTNEDNNLLKCLKSDMVNEMPLTLTPEQTACLPLWKNSWRKIGLSVTPTNETIAEETIKNLYVAAAYKLPKEIIWCCSPLQGDKEAQKKIHNRQLGFWLDDLISENCVVFNDIANSLDNKIINSICNKINKLAIGDYLFRQNGHLHANLLSCYSFLHVCCRVEPFNILQPLVKMATQVGWYWCFNKVAILTKKPVEITKKHVKYADGTIIEW